MENLPRGPRRDYRRPRNDRDPRDVHRDHRGPYREQHGYYGEGGYERGYARNREYRPANGRPSFQNSCPPLEKIARVSLWDKPAPGFEGVSAARAKACGLFPEPGEPSRTTDQAEIQRLLSHAATNYRSQAFQDSKLTPLDSRVAKMLILRADFSVVRLERVKKYLENYLLANIVPNVNYEDVKIQMHPTQDPNTVIVHTLRSTVATALFALTGLEVLELNTTLCLERPKEYVVFNPNDTSVPQEPLEDVVESSQLYVARNVPYGTPREKLLELLQPLAKVRSLAQVLDKLTYESKGVAFFEMVSEDPDILTKLNKLAIDDQELQIFRACENPERKYEQAVILSAETLFGALQSDKISPHAPSEIVQFLNCVAVEDLVDSVKYNDIKVAFEAECSYHGHPEKVLIPRPEGDFRPGMPTKPEVGRIFVKFPTLQEAQKCAESLAGRKFNGRTILAAYYEPDDFSRALF
ncbi:hypothetical protein KL930_000179 [Ogataea haglerorum]|nr:hypothetical protein KL915_000398 [Ogataea haglerorum]KAG7777800.1 hypothetical protein KL922_002618 [Ogataea haglerorum]KAG7782845.1 hypothetical protein KL930_000179 [Ogataea haglerorum]